MKFQLSSPFVPTGDQPQAIGQLVKGLRSSAAEQVLLGVTGSGKTFTMANVISHIQKPTLVISHNKTLAAQLYQEFKSFFPQNAVCYFVSYYDYYQPEAYIPQSDTYIEKETEINEEIDKLRLAATTNLLTRPDTLIVASVSCIYNIGSPKEYGEFILELRPGVKVEPRSILARLVELQYLRSDFDFRRGTFRWRGDTIDVFPAYEDTGVRIVMTQDRIQRLAKLDPVTGNLLEELPLLVLYPAKHYMTDIAKHKEVFKQIEKDLDEQVKRFKQAGKLVEAQRLSQKVHYDLEMIQEVGFVNGIENYSRYFDGRRPGEPPFSLFDYFQEKYGADWLLFVDESHMTIPQIRGMYHGDQSRKQTLVNFGFRLEAAMDNRPLRFDEFLRRIPQTVYVSATPDEWEIGRAKTAAQTVKNVILGRSVSDDSRISSKTTEKTDSGHASLARMTKYSGVIEQLIRPTGLVDPIISIRPVAGQIDDLIREIEKRVAKKERVLVTTLTKRMAEDLSAYLDEKNLKVQYLHSDVQTLERSDILDDLRQGKYDVLVGINLLREGLDLPEVSLVAILDADKEGFLRSRVSLVQVMGRAARHVAGSVIMYADTVTKSMRGAIDEVNRRRQIQLDYNQKHKVTPQSIHKPVREKLAPIETRTVEMWKKTWSDPVLDMQKIDLNALTPQDRNKFIKKLEVEMRAAATELNFELAAQIRDKVRELKSKAI
ncbi:MAG: UvrABC system protein B [Candidatus Gottesmanbacteria bacterium GW2011_GWB1_43_11]|uniref:UvrABC system protein B n=1 Tax=Candidatus Gottesmanbacteria bacterium GW2011_GWB1_43_11 TaxID=1618446 RepID=A0A0G1EVS3_9BACT|nr:MAG: UvrABC system protein B [Candidatus Gottesmanbacteria bacterium GW2011_GWA2_42_16]KKS55625.1 MAG: UvrABC system protein B [Candidatus Gottesmanbacteria bacterium GW2011_GWA1_42_26]KKS82218.1 MAG: excinuclease ABC subunit B, excinuclease ABC subunit B [Candidatus Gottesmanbacteria bacterium GW2011_GWC1_43_10]KKS87116.1 MAG: UvrABC system protein B [Candidatus Gottesmanbacteria bacterium GW2011_GWB1_43_11]OGG10396.1 MAG: excinuclease ABC subunit B [Candidatus Gottesmanbacteria bacterium R